MRIGHLTWDQDLLRMNYVRKKFLNKGIMLDAIMGTLDKWDFNIIKNKIKYFENLNIKWIEEPFNPEDLESYKKLRKFRKLKIAIGESFYLIQ